jgi:hypothetical protein
MKICPQGGRADYESVVTPKRGFLNKEKAPVRALEMEEAKLICE